MRPALASAGAVLCLALRVGVRAVRNSSGIPALRLRASSGSGSSSSGSGGTAASDAGHVSAQSVGSVSGANIVGALNA